MNETKKPLHHFNTAQITKLAEEQGIEVDGKDRLQLIKEVKDATSIGDEAVAPQISQDDGGSSQKATPTGFSGKRVKINIPRQEGVGGSDVVSLFINGYRCDIQREQDVEVLEEFLDLMDTLIITERKEIKGKVEYHDRKRFPFR